MTKPKRRTIGLVTFGEVDREGLSFLPASLEGILGLAGRWGASLPIPQDSYRAERGQFLASHFLESLASLPGGGHLRLLGISDVDLFTPSLNFIFGQAVIGGRNCLVSTARLNPSFYGEPGDPALFRERVIKETVHELGHTFGLDHCRDTICVMHFSNSLADTDRKGSGFCPRCRQRYIALLG